jgi:8-amino-7-oxononanoate synthase
MSSVIFSRWMASQKPRAHTMRSAPAFYRNLEEALDVRRKDHGLYTLIKNTWAEGVTADFCSNDSLSFGASGRLRKAFEEELARNPGAQLGAGGSRLMDGNYDYIEAVEQEIADYHGVEAALIVGSGCDGNYAIFEGIPRPGDAIIYDELVHASIVDGMSRSLASTKVPFAHNDVDAFREALISVWDSQPLIKQGKKCVLIVVESFYSMEGDMSPLKELVQAAKEIFPGGNAQFIVDEAHSMGVVGERGLGFAEALGLGSEIAIKTHTFSKAFGSIGGRWSLDPRCRIFAKLTTCTRCCPRQPHRQERTGELLAFDSVHCCTGFPSGCCDSGGVRVDAATRDECGKFPF